MDIDVFAFMNASIMLHDVKIKQIKTNKGDKNIQWLFVLEGYVDMYLNCGAI